jgi:hypothetical protein
VLCNWMSTFFLLCFPLLRNSNISWLSLLISTLSRSRPATANADAEVGSDDDFKPPSAPPPIAAEGPDGAPSPAPQLQPGGPKPLAKRWLDVPGPTRRTIYLFIKGKVQPDEDMKSKKFKLALQDVLNLFPKHSVDIPGLKEVSALCTCSPSLFL